MTSLEFENWRADAEHAEALRQAAWRKRQERGAAKKKGAHTSKIANPSASRACSKKPSRHAGRTRKGVKT